MTIAAIIAEFNPFHNGHSHLIKEVREKCKADYIVAIMSGDFVQRGAPAVCNKYLRAEMAVKSGVDAVFELPVIYATSAAPDFAFGGVSMAHNMGCCDILAFGSECGDCKFLQDAANLLSEETAEFKAKLTSALKMGLSYPAAISAVVFETMNESAELLKSPNNTLGIEYLKALKVLNSTIRPFTIKRHLTSHHEADFIEDKETGIFYTGASHIRDILKKNEDTDILRKCMPASAADLFLNEINKCLPVISDDFSLPLSLMLEKMTSDDVRGLTGNSDSKAKLAKNLSTFERFSELRKDLKDKSLTENTVGRLLVHALLEIYDKDIDREKGAAYLRLLAMNKAASPLLKKIKETTAIPIITKTADFDIDSCPMLQKDIYASNLYNKVVSEKFDCRYTNDIIHSPKIV